MLTFCAPTRCSASTEIAMGITDRRLLASPSFQRRFSPQRVVTEYVIRCQSAEDIQCEFSADSAPNRHVGFQYVNPRGARVSNHLLLAGRGRISLPPPPRLTPDLIGGARSARRRSKTLNEGIIMPS